MKKYTLRELVEMDELPIKLRINAFGELILLSANYNVAVKTRKKLKDNVWSKKAAICLSTGVKTKDEYMGNATAPEGVVLSFMQDLFDKVSDIDLLLMLRLQRKLNKMIETYDIDWDKVAFTEK